MGVATFLGTIGLGALAGVGLMALGTDQIITGVWNIASGVQVLSVFEYGGNSAAMGVGFSENASQTIGQWTPAALSLGMMGAGAMLRRQGGNALDGIALGLNRYGCGYFATTTHIHS